MGDTSKPPEARRSRSIEAKPKIMEEEPKIEEPTQSPRKRHPLKVWIRTFWYKVLEYTHLKDDTDYEATVKYISDGVEFRGMNLWVLAFAIIVASVGLNVNSTAVIIGAMLISPIMGPIMGIGLPMQIPSPGLILLVGRSPGEGNGYPVQCSCLENSMDRGPWQATVHGVEESQT